MRRLQNKNLTIHQWVYFIQALFIQVIVCMTMNAKVLADIQTTTKTDRPVPTISHENMFNSAELSWLCVGIILNEELASMKLDSIQKSAREEAIIAFLTDWKQTIRSSLPNPGRFSSRIFINNFLKQQAINESSNVIKVMQLFYSQEISPNSRFAISRIMHQEGLSKWKERLELILQASMNYLAINGELPRAAIQIGHLMSNLDWMSKNKQSIEEYFESIARAPLTRQISQLLGTDTLIPGGLALKALSLSRIGILIGRQFETIMQTLKQTQNLNFARSSIITSVAAGTTGVIGYNESETQKNLNSILNEKTQSPVQPMASERQFPSIEELIIEVADLLMPIVETKYIHKKRADRLIDAILISEAETAAQKFNWSPVVKNQYLTAAYKTIDEASMKVGNIIERRHSQFENLSFEDIYYIRSIVYPFLSKYQNDNSLSILSVVGASIPESLKGIAHQVGTNNISSNLILTSILAPHFQTDKFWRLGVLFYANTMRPVVVPEATPFRNTIAWDLLHGEWVPEQYMIDVYSPEAFLVNWLYQLKFWYNSPTSQNAATKVLSKIKRNDFLIEDGVRRSTTGYNCNGACHPLTKVYFDQFGPLMSQIFNSDVTLPITSGASMMSPPIATEAQETIPHVEANRFTSFPQYLLAKAFESTNTSANASNQEESMSTTNRNSDNLKLSPWEFAKGVQVKDSTFTQIEDIYPINSHKFSPWSSTEWNLNYVVSGPRVNSDDRLSTKDIQAILLSFSTIAQSAQWRKWKDSHFDLDQMITSLDLNGTEILKSLKTIRTLKILHQRTKCPTNSFCATLLRQIESTGLLSDYIEFERKTQAQLKVLTSSSKLQTWLKQMETLSDDILISRLHWLLWINEISKFQNDLIPTDKLGSAFAEIWNSQQITIGKPPLLPAHEIQNLQLSISAELTKIQNQTLNTIKSNSHMFQVSFAKARKQNNRNGTLLEKNNSVVSTMSTTVSDRVYRIIFLAGYVKDSSPTIMYDFYLDTRKKLTSTSIEWFKSRKLLNLHTTTHSYSASVLQEILKHKNVKSKIK